ncbi:MAG: FHA domain-containing protein [Pseudomonadota bacterium]
MAKLQLIFDGKIKREYDLNKTELYIGRHPSNDIIIDNKGVSGKHAVVYVEGKDFIVKDLDSTNGTKLNGKKITSAKLHHGDHINLFKHTLNFILLNEKNDPAENLVAGNLSNSVNPDATIMLDANQINNMGSAYKATKNTSDNKNTLNQPRLEVTSADQIKTIILSNKSVLIGKKENCDIQTGGWLFTPAISALIKKDMTGMYTIKPETAIKLNDKKIKDKQLLQNGDRILVRDTLIIFMI